MRKLFFLFLALVATTSLWAEDFSVDGIYYNYLEDNNVEVTYRGNNYHSYDDEYAGEVIIPSTVTYNSTTYSVTSIGDGAFYYCSSLTSITIPNSVTSIGVQAFRNCSSLTSITIPNSVTSIGGDAFYDCSSLTTPVYNAHCFAYMPTSFKGAYVIPEGIKQIAGGAFWNCSSLTSITIPNSVTSIGDVAFFGCSSLTSVAIPNSVTSIGYWAFSNCSSFVSMVVESGNTKYDSRDNCNAIIETATNILIAGCQNTIIPNSVTSIGNRAFQDCSALTSITIPNSVTSIGEMAFTWCSSLTSITIPNSVTSIGNYAFSSCSSLTSVTIPNSVTSIGTGAFSDCFSLTTPVYNAHCFAYMPTSFKGAYVIPEGIKQIAGGAFQDCSSLTSVTIPNSVTSIGDYAFSRCSSLVSMVVESGNTKYDSRDNCNAIIETATNILIAVCQNTIIPNSVTSIGKSAFYCSSLTSITIPNSVTSIGETAFSNCKSLTSITIPNSVTSIGDAAFVYCRSLTSVTIGNSVTSIGGSAFTGCSSLTSITCLGTTPPEADNLEAPTTTCKLIVPHSAYNAYFRHAYWGQFLNIISGYAITLHTNNDQWGEVTGDGLYTNDTTITITATPYEGYTFSHWSDGNTDNPRVVQVTEDKTYTAYFEVKRIIKEDYSYPSRDDNKYTLENNWVSSRAERNFIAPGTEGMVRGMAMKDGVMYFINRELRALVPVDVATGQMGEPIFITGEHLFETETEVEGVMEWKSAVTLPFNDVKVDHAGNVLIGACLTNAQTFFVYKVNLETGEATEVIKERLYDNPEFDGMEYRFDAFGVYGDVDGNACIMAANGKGMDVYRWIIKDGVADKAERILIQLDPEFDVSYNINVTSLGTPPQIYPQDETGSAFYVDGKDLYPMLIDEDGLLVEDMIHIPTGLKVVNNPGDTLTIDGAMNGLIEFQVGDEYFFLMAASNFNKSIPATFALFKFADASRSFADAEPLWYFPAKGMGDGFTKNTCFTAPVSVEVDGNTATIAVYSQNLGYASYTLTIGETVQKHQLTVLSNDNAMGTVSGSGTYNKGKNVTIKATAKEGYHFSHWNDGNTDNPRVVEITQDTTFTAYFKDNLYTISVDANNSEAGFTQGSGTYKYGTYTEITATANNGYHFSHWDDGNTDNPRVVQVTGDATYTAHFDKNTYTVTTYCNSEYGVVTPSTSGAYLDIITLEAISNIGYSFSQWSDGNTDNPRALLLTQDTILMAEFTQAYSGKCGDDLYWAYDNTTQTLSISGMGDMYNYTATTQPWVLFKDQIMTVDIANTATSIGTSAFEGCRRIGTVNIGANIIEIGENAFAGCTRLYDIYCYPTYPPFAETSSFANYNVYLYVPCVNIREYEMDIVWGNFKYIKCMGAEGDEVEDGTVEVTPSTTSVTITWPTEENANTYIIEIKKDGVVFCRLTFNADGQLLSISFAPGRNGNHPAQYATKTTNGLRFTVTGLEEGTNYTYDVISKDENNESIETYSGEFTTQSDVTTSVSDSQSPMANCQKIFRNGQLIIIRDGVEYNAMGQEIQ